MTQYFRRVLVERDRDTTTIWLNDPDKLNVLSRSLMEEMIAALDDVGRSDATGVVIAAKGRLFSAGHDFTEMAGQDLESVRSLFVTCTTMMRSIQRIPQPVVARVHALATGAGCQLVATADLAIASTEASFCTPGGKGGLFCTTPMVAVGRALPPKRALEMAMSGDAIDATTALEWGFVNQVVEPGDLESASLALLGRVTRGSAASKGIGKRAFYEQIGREQDAAYEFCVDVMANAALSPDAQESIAAFIEKRQPTWR